MIKHSGMMRVVNFNGTLILLILAAKRVMGTDPWIFN
jgi:hypothetical protein